MSREVRIWAPVIAAIVLAVSATGAMAANTVVPKTTTSTIEVRGTNGYWITINAVANGGRGTAKVRVTATNERGKQGETFVEYATKGKLTKGGGIEAKLNGLGRIDVDFTQAGKAERIVYGGVTCGNPKVQRRKGTFRGTISFHGERGFTKVKRRSAEGQIREISKQVCPPEEPYEPVYGIEGNQSVVALGESAGGSVSFDAAGPALRATAPPNGIPTVEFTARYVTERRGMQVTAFEADNTGSALFVMPTGPPTTATVTPPMPFEGSATFQLLTPTSANWTGDLRIDFPGIGTVPLTGPGIATTICEGATCTDTLPPG